MSRYPGSTFQLVDNTNVSASVPIQSVNPAAPTYLTGFRSVKGDEGIQNEIYGNAFYDMYGTQDNILFSKYGQPLLQAAMDINGGAKLISKRIVLDDANLAHSTVGIVLSKQITPTVTIEDKTYTFNGVSKTLPCITGVEFVETDVKYTVNTMVSSLKNTENVDYILSGLVEKKEVYGRYRDDIMNRTLNISNFELENIKVAAGDSIAVKAKYADSTVDKVFSHQLTAAEVAGMTNNTSIVNGFTKIGNAFTKEATAQTLTVSMTEDYTSEAEYNAALNAQIVAIYDAILGTTESCYYPLFTVFDNGRGKSTKAISIVFDGNTSKTLQKAVYGLKVYNYATNKSLESFAFTVDPTSRNNNTGYCFDIESAVNANSKQVNVKFYEKSFDKLVDVLMDSIGCDAKLFESTDVLFGHRLDGSYPVIESNVVVGGLSKKNYVYDYANIKLDSANLYVDMLKNSNNSSASSTSTSFKYYFYDYPHRNSLGLTEKLEHGTDGYNVNRITTDATNGAITSKYPTVVVFEDGDEHTYTDLNTAKYNVYENVDLVPVVPNNFVAYNNTNMVRMYTITDDGAGNKSLTQITLTDGETIYIPKTEESLYDEQYTAFYNGDFDKDIFNLDVYFPTAIFDANYCDATKLAIQRLAAYRGDMLAYMDMGIKKVNSFENVSSKIPTELGGQTFDDLSKPYIRDMHVAVTCIYYDIRDPFTNKQITVTAPYSLSLVFINFYITGVGKVFAGINNGVTIASAISGTVNYVPKIFPTNAMTSLNNIGMTYPSESETIRNEKQLMNDLRCNYGSYYDSVFVMDTEYTLNPTESEYSYINNVLLVNQLMQAIRKSCPASRYNFITEEDLEAYEKAVTNVTNTFASRFASIKFRYVNDENSIANKRFYAAIEVVFKPFAQSELFTITALNYSTLSQNVTTV